MLGRPMIGIGGVLTLSACLARVFGHNLMPIKDGDLRGCQAHPQNLAGKPKRH